MTWDSLYSAAAKPVSLLQRVEIGDDILPIGLIGEIDEHLGPVNEANRVCEEFVEVGVVPGDVRVLHRGGEVESRNRAALAPGNTGERWSDFILTRRRRMAHCAVGRKDLFAGRRIAGVRMFGDPYVCELDCRLFTSEARNAPA